MFLLHLRFSELSNGVRGFSACGFSCAHDDVMCVYLVAMLDFKEGCGYFEVVTVCHFIISLSARLVLFLRKSSNRERNLSWVQSIRSFSWSLKL